MNALVKKLIENEKFEQYAKDVKEKISPISLSGLSDVGKAHIIISTAENLKCPIFILTYNEMQAKEMINSLKFFAGLDINYMMKLYIYLKKKFLHMIMNHKVKTYHMKE